MDLIVSNSINKIVHFTFFSSLLCANQFHFPSSLLQPTVPPKFGICYLLLHSGPTRLFCFKTKLLSFPPFLKLILMWLPSCFSDNAKAFHEFFKSRYNHFTYVHHPHMSHVKNCSFHYWLKNSTAQFHLVKLKWFNTHTDIFNQVRNTLKTCQFENATK